MMPRSGANPVVLWMLLASLPGPPRAAASDAPPPAARLIRLTESAPGDSAARATRGTLAETAPQWTLYVSDTANRVTTEHPTGRSPWSLRLATRKLAATPASWHVGAILRNQVLQELSPRTAYVLRFRAMATARRPITLELARHHEPYLNLGLGRELILDETPRTYELGFTTGDTIPPLRDPASSGVWLSLGAGQALGTVLLGDVTLERATPLRFEGRPLTLGSFDPGECWGGGQTGGGVAAGGLILAAPANGGAFAWREIALDLSHGAWDLVLDVRTASPLDIGRVAVLLRSGPNDGSAYAYWSFSGLDSGWNRIVIPRERFLNYVWQGRIDWAALRAVAVKLETNGNWPGEIELGRVTVQPRADRPALPPVITRFAVPVHGRTRARIAWQTDVPAACTFEYGPTPAYGESRSLPDRSTRHGVEIAGLEPAHTYHARVRAVADSGVTACSGDFTFVTDPAAPWIAGRAPSRFPLGLYIVSTPEDIEHVGTTDFDCIITYRFTSCFDSDAEARSYLDTTAAAGKRTLIGLCTRAAARGDTAALLGRVRALAGHPALLGWYLYDEPENQRTDPAPLRRDYEAIHRADPTHPVVIGSWGLGPTYPYRDIFDLALVDQYPVPFLAIDSLVTTLRRARASDRNFGFVFQSYATEYQRWPGSERGPGRYPSAEEMRAMAWLGVVFGAKALWSFAYSYLQDTPGSEWHWMDLLALARELRQLEPLLLAPESPGARVTSCSSPWVQACVRSLGGRLYLITVNPDATAATATLMLAGATAPSALEVFSARKVPCAAGKLTDTWPAFGVRIYLLGGP